MGSFVNSGNKGDTSISAWPRLSMMAVGTWNYDGLKVSLKNLNLILTTSYILYFFPFGCVCDGYYYYLLMDLQLSGSD